MVEYVHTFYVNIQGSELLENIIKGCEKDGMPFKEKCAWIISSLAHFHTCFIWMLP